jgi:hypothetical protein
VAVAERFGAPTLLAGLFIEAGESDGFAHGRDDDDVIDHERGLGVSPLGWEGLVLFLEVDGPVGFVGGAVNSVDLAEAADHVDGIVFDGGNPAGAWM